MPVLESFGVALGRLMQLFLFATMTRDLDQDSLVILGGESRWGITPSDPIGTTMRRINSAQGGNRIITRTCAILRSNMSATQKDLSRATHVMRRKFDSRFPQPAGIEMEYKWVGHLCLTLNGVAQMRELDKGVFSGCVQNGLGTARGTLTGIGAAEIACGVQSDVTKYFTNEAQPKRLNPRPARDLGPICFYIGANGAHAPSRPKSLM
jgi:glycine/D-amino acid oxidase-like deaminating enzyme